MESEDLDEKDEQESTFYIQGREDVDESFKRSAKIKRSKKIIFTFLKNLFIYSLIFMLCVVVIPRYVLQRTEVDGSSMENTLHNFDNLIVEKVTYHFKDPARFDIVTLYPEGRESSESYIKRIIGLPGENVRIDNDQIYINGDALKEDFGKEDFIADGGIAAGRIGITLGEDEFFVMGDNRNHSKDSRFEVGPVKRQNIDGRAVFRICSFKNKKNGIRGALSFKDFGTLK